MARDGSSDNSGKPDDEPTRYANHGGQQQRSPQSVDVADPPHTPWFRRRPVLIAWIALIVLMIALVIWGIIQLTSRGPGGTTAPSTTSATTTTTSTSATSTATTAKTTTPQAAPHTTAGPPPARPPGGAPAPAGPANEPPHHRHHLPPLPSEITIPPMPRAPEVPTVITLPPGL
jgi:cytoskeletal protein RodZ